MRPAGATVLSSPAREKAPSPGIPGILAGSGSRSRGRSAGSSNSMFSSRSKSVSRSSAATEVAMGAALEEGEPSSPKVTCIGQVRMRNKKPPAKPVAPRVKGDAGAPRQCFHRALLHSLLPVRRKPMPGGGGGTVAARARSLWRGWVAFSNGRSGGKCRYQRREPDSPGTPPAKAEDEEATMTMSATATPPKNAFLLTRCRSVPHHSSPSSLPASARCAVSPLPAAEAVSRDMSMKDRGELRGSWKEITERRDMAEEEEEEEGGMVSESQRAPLVLTRCRSEPAARRRMT